MRLDFHISPETYQAIKAEATERGLTESVVVRQHLNQSLNLPDTFKPRHIKGIKANA